MRSGVALHHPNASGRDKDRGQDRILVRGARVSMVARTCGRRTSAAPAW